MRVCVCVRGELLKQCENLKREKCILNEKKLIEKGEMISRET